MLKWAKDLFPICRSITGDGVRNTLKYFKKINPEFIQLSFKTGKKVFDWTIPQEWKINDAYFQHESGKKFADFKKNNLHVIGYSSPINKTIKKKSFQSIYIPINFNPMLYPMLQVITKKDGVFVFQKMKRKNYQKETIKF